MNLPVALPTSGMKTRVFRLLVAWVFLGRSATEQASVTIRQGATVTKDTGTAEESIPCQITAGSRAMHECSREHFGMGVFPRNTVMLRHSIQDSKCQQGGSAQLSRPEAHRTPRSSPKAFFPE